jgi:hypothetical protein
MTIKNTIIGILAVAVISFGASALYFSFVNGNLGANPGITHWQSEAFLQGIYAGTGQQLSISNAGALTTSGGITNTGTLTQSGAAVFSGAVSGISTSSLTTLTVSGDTRLKSPVKTGSVCALAQPTGATTTVISATNACDCGLGVATTSITAASTLNLPTAEAMYADCLTTNGDSVRLFVKNATASTTVVTAGSASSTIAYDGSTGGSATLAASSWAELRFVRAADNAMVVVMDQYKF